MASYRLSRLAEDFPEVSELDLNLADDSVRHRNAVQVKQGLDHDRGADPANQRPVMLWAYDPLAFGGKGRAAIAIGDPDHADDIAVIVPGAGSSVASGWLAGGGSFSQTSRPAPASLLSRSAFSSASSSWIEPRAVVMK